MPLALRDLPRHRVGLSLTTSRQPPARLQEMKLQGDARVFFSSSCLPLSFSLLGSLLAQDGLLLFRGPFPLWAGSDPSTGSTPPGRDSQTAKSWQGFSWTRSYEGRAAPLRRNRWMYNVLGARTMPAQAGAGPHARGPERKTPGWSSPTGPLRSFRTSWKRLSP